MPGRTRLLIAALLLAYAAHAGFYVVSASPNVDEGFYALAAREVYRGRLPYRDFGYTQAPCFPYLQGLPLLLLGHDQWAQRALNALWGGLTLALLVTQLRRSRYHWGLAVAGALALTPGWVHFVVLGKAYALAGLLILLSVAGLRLRDPRWQALSFGLAGSLAVGSRLPVAVAVAILWIAALLEARTARARRWLAIAPPVIGASLAAPFAASDPEAFWFWNVAYHLSSGLEIRGASLGEVLEYVGPLLGLAALILTADHRRRPLPGERGLLTAGALGLASQYIPPGAYAEYVTPLLPLLALGVAQCVQRVRLPKWAPLAWCVLVAGPLLSDGVSSTYRERASDFLAATRHMQRYPPHTTVLTPHPILTSGAGLTPYRHNLMGSHSVTDELPPARAERLGLLTVEALTAAVAERRADLVAITTHEINFVISVPSCLPHRAGRMDAFWRHVDSNYVVDYENANVIVLRRRAEGPPG